jgi:hypothetical protein
VVFSVSRHGVEEVVRMSNYRARIEDSEIEPRTRTPRKSVQCRPVELFGTKGKGMRVKRLCVWIALATSLMGGPHRAA